MATKSSTGSTPSKKTAPAAMAKSTTKTAKSVEKTAKSTKRTTKAKLVSTGITPDQRSQMIAEAAYFNAEKRGFDPNGQVDDWLQAETMVDEMISQSAGSSSAQRH